MSCQHARAPSRLQESYDPSFSAADDFKPLIFVEALAYGLVAVYTLWVVYLVCQGFKHLRQLTLPFRVVFLLSAISILGLVVCLFTGAYSPFTTSTTLFMSLGGITNVYVWTVAVAYMPWEIERHANLNAAGELELGAVFFDTGPLVLDPERRGLMADHSDVGSDDDDDGAGAGAGAGASHHHSKRLDQPQSESARHVPCGIVESHALRKRCGLVPKTRPPLFGRLQFVAESCVRRFFGALAPDVSSATFPPFYMVAQTRCSLVNGVYCKV